MSEKKRYHKPGSLQPNIEDILQWNDLPADAFEPATSEEKENFIQERKSVSYWKDAWRRLTKNKIAILSLVLIFIYILLAVFVPIFSKYGYADVDSGKMNQFLSTEHWFGTDSIGRDLWVRVWRGARVSLSIGFIAAILNAVLGAFVGGISGYYGGKIDLWGQRVIEVWSGMPTLFLIILLSSVVQPNFWWLLGITVLFGWMALVGVVRAEFLRTRNFDYIRAAQALGVSDRGIIFRHMLPNAVVATLTFLPFILCSSITTLTSLDFLGFGLPLGSPSLGELLLQGKNNLQAPWLGIAAFLSVAVLLSLLIFIGEAVRDAFDPNKAV